jgi:mortality factor 4-like protein 1
MISLRKTWINEYFSRWDEWISEERVLKYTETNLQKQKQLKEMNSKRKPSRASSAANTSSLLDSTESRSRKRHRDSSIDKARFVSGNA